MTILTLSRRIFAQFSIVILFTLTLAGCGAGAPAGGAAVAPATGVQTYIAKLEGAPASARVVTVMENGKFDAYVCSFDDAFNLTSARWYKGQLDANGSYQAVSQDGVELKGTITGDQFSGSLLNTAKQQLAFSGTRVPADGKAGLYRGIGKYNGDDVIVGATMSLDGTLAATAQYKGVFKFVTPVASEPVALPDNSLGIKIGPNGEQITVKRVTTLSGPPLF